MASTSGRRNVLILTNKSGGGVVAGDVVVVDTSTDESFTTTTSASSSVPIGIAQETIANNASGRVATTGYVALVNTSASVTRGDYAFTHTVAKQATGSASRAGGAFGVYLKSSATPSAWLFGLADGSSAGLGAWTDYTPTWGASVTPPTLGSSTVVGRYKLLDSKTMAISIVATVTTGGAWNAGSGSYNFTLPGGTTSAARLQVVAAEVNDASTRHYTCTGRIVASDTKVVEIATADASASHTVTNTVPITWATGDTIAIAGIIEIA